jgi:hypothetical protein
MIRELPTCSPDAPHCEFCRGTGHVWSDGWRCCIVCEGVATAGLYVIELHGTTNGRRWSAAGSPS